MSWVAQGVGQPETSPRFPSLNAAEGDLYDLTLDGDDDAGVEPEEELPPPPLPGKGGRSGKGSAKGGESGAKGELLCVICGVNKRSAKQSFCSSPCAADVRAAERDAKAQGAEALKAFKKVRKLGNDEFVVAIHTYRSKCAGFGRGVARPAFQWVRYLMLIEVASRVEVGTKSVWLSRGAYLELRMKDDELSREAALAAWAHDLETLPPGRVSAALRRHHEASKRRRCGCPAETYIWPSSVSPNTQISLEEGFGAYQGVAQRINSLF